MEWYQEQQVDPYVYDLEFIGDVQNINTCYIWEICVYHISSGQCFKQIIDPDPAKKTFPLPPIKEIPQLTRKFLDDNDAKHWSQVWPMFKMWINQTCQTFKPVFISHNTFRADKPLLELECQRIDELMPFKWYFFDSLHYCRENLSDYEGNYSLMNIYVGLFKTPFKNAHRAEADVHACLKILQHISPSFQLCGPIYPTYATSLRSIRWVGHSSEKQLYYRQIRSIEHLMVFLTNMFRQFVNVSYEELIRNWCYDVFTNIPCNNIDLIKTSIVSLVKKYHTKNQ